MTAKEEESVRCCQEFNKMKKENVYWIYYFRVMVRENQKGVD